MSAHRVLHDFLRAFETNGPGKIKDPGDAGTITVTKWGQVCEVTTAGVETRILAAPTRPGVLCAVVLDVYVGAMTLSVRPASGTAYGYNADNATTIVFGSAGDFVIFYSIEIGTEYVWRVVAQEGTNVALEDFAADQITCTDLTLNSLTVDTADMTEGAAGITAGTGTICEHRITQFGTIIKTEILIDLTGLNSGGSDGDIIGKNAAADCHIGQITAAKNGTIFAGRMSCLETPAGGEPDIDLYCATESTGTEDTAISGLVETALLDAGADWTAAMAPKGLTANPAANKYLYLVASGGATDATYTAGIMMIELWGK